MDTECLGRSPRRLLFAAAVVGFAAATAAAAPPADARRGEALFVGSARLAAGGAPCLGCHGIAGHGLARAASFGPDLSDAHAQYGPEALDGMLEDVSFPSMAPLYRDHGVTREERAALVAFLAEAAARPAPAGGGFVPGFAAGVAAAALAFLALVVAVGRRGRAASRRMP